MGEPKTLKRKSFGQAIYDIALSIDQLGNTIALGNVDCTISARTYVMTQVYTSWFWFMLMWVIDCAFEPIHGKGHCQQAYDSERKEDYYAPSTWTIVFLSVFIIPICLFVIRPITWTYKKLTTKQLR